jgi:lipopolysaccharide/colanic/teichoic acid biosynthesis glycosyltransferase
MQLFRWLRSRVRPRLTSARLLPIEKFKAVFGRERARADRREECLTLILLRVQGVDEALLQGFVRAAVQRLRCTDEVGWCETDVLAFLLPDTGTAGADKVGSDLDELLATRSIAQRTQTLVYPRDWYPAFLDQTGGRTDGERRGGNREPLCERDRCRTNGLATDGDGAKTPSQHQPSRFALHDAPLAVQTIVLPRWKRLTDVVVATLALAVVAPLMLVIACLVRVTSKGPIVFRQLRCGAGGRTFTIYKFRTMRCDAETRQLELQALNEVSGPVFKIRKDPRRTPIGKILRKTSLDELPQLWNVLLGHMSLVGPRPPLPNEVRQYKAWHRRRLDIVGGITGIWQVEGRSRIGFEEWMRLDIAYLRKRSLWTDLLILLRTIPAVITCRGAR